MSRKPPTSRAGRIARLGGLTSRVSTSYLGQRIKGAFQDQDTRERALRRLHLENAERVVSTMGNLKGAAMKVGQGLAQVVEGMDLPDEVSGVLSKLNDRAEPVPFPIIERAVERELEGKLSSLFADFSTEPLGTASLAQAHAARLLDGRSVVVKVLHHGIEGSVDSDLRALRSLLVTGRVLRREKAEIDAIFAEIRERLREELDYYQEAANIEFFRRRMRIDGVEIPATHPERSTGRVLTMDRLEGLPLDEFLKTADTDARQRAATLVATTFHDMFYRLRTLHADPHAGNYLFRPDGGMGLLDFGCVKRFDLYWTGRYARMARAIVQDDTPEFVRQARAIGVLHSDDPESIAILTEFAQIICVPLRVPTYRCGTDDDDVLSQVKKIVPRTLRRPDIRSPRELVFLHRALGGVYSMLRRLGHHYSYSSLFSAHANHAIAVADGTVEDGSPLDFDPWAHLGAD